MMKNGLRRGAAVTPLFGALVLTPLLFMTQSGLLSCGGGGGGGGVGPSGPVASCDVKAGTITLPPTQAVVEALLDVPFSFASGSSQFRRTQGIVLESRDAQQTQTTPVTFPQGKCLIGGQPTCGDFKITLPADVTVERGASPTRTLSVTWQTGIGAPTASVPMVFTLNAAATAVSIARTGYRPLLTATCGQALSGIVGSE